MEESLRIKPRYCFVYVEFKLWIWKYMNRVLFWYLSGK